MTLSGNANNALFNNSRSDLMPCAVEMINLHAWYGQHHVLKDISMLIPRNEVTAIIGPSGCGKSTLIRCFNRLHESVYGARISGAILIEGTNVMQSDAVRLRKRVGMVFQRPNLFPTMSIFDNVATGVKLNCICHRQDIPDVVEDNLRKAALWDEVKDDLDKPPSALSGGQQQRLSIARTLALQPFVLLMDEPCSALDPISTAKIENLMREIKKFCTIIIVTHNMQQAARIAAYSGFVLNGELIEFDTSEKIFTNPSKQETEDYITGRFG